ncbi:RDD family protein [Neobacillus novalis]|uniref:RDD family protein n=1 Tax=Neobacillus novalis TaxID=220687 RepID=A0AA95MJ68_9BACI|nr:RDD family protein [Neobacillus novalis]WHY84122.1 RDD family protein [Neobacillus novalis]
MQANLGQKEIGQWYYIKNGEQIGPVNESELLYLFREGFLNGDALVWTKNMERWEKARKFQQFADVLIVPPPIPVSPRISESIDFRKAPPKKDAVGTSKQITNPSGYSKARPWIRYWARTIDMIIFGMAMAIVVSILSPSFMEDSIGTFFSFFAMLIWLFVEPLMLTLFGNTLGKAVLNIKISMADGRKITYQTALKRTFSVWLKGLGLGIPIASLICLALSIDHLNKNNVTKWDKEYGFVVTHGKVGFFRGFLAIVIPIVVMFICLIIIGIIWAITLGAI